MSGLPQLENFMVQGSMVQISMVQAKDLCHRCNAASQCT